MEPEAARHDVFISHSTKDKAVADTVCAGLEANGVRCWIAPRDIIPGRSWAEAITEAIDAAAVTVVIFSANANGSEQVTREVAESVSAGNVILPFRIENITPSKSMRYFLSTPHWLDAITPPLENHVRSLVGVARALLAGNPAPAWQNTPPAGTEPAAFEPIKVPSEGAVNLDELSRQRSRGKIRNFLSTLLTDK
jgi:hypothetical protein